MSGPSLIMYKKAGEGERGGGGVWREKRKGGNGRDKRKERAEEGLRGLETILGSLIP